MERELTRRRFLKVIPGVLLGLVAGETLADPLKPPMSGKSPERITLDDHEKKLVELAEVDLLTVNTLMNVAVISDMNDTILDKRLKRVELLVPDIQEPDLFLGKGLQQAKTVFKGKNGPVRG